jgi:hypothetical protein
MSDELDPELSRLFTEATQPLPDSAFHARLMERLERPHGWLGVASTLIATVRSALSGLATGIATPFSMRFGRVGLMAASGAAVMLFLTLQSA